MVCDTYILHGILNIGFMDGKKMGLFSCYKPTFSAGGAHPVDDFPIETFEFTSKKLAMASSDFAGWWLLLTPLKNHGVKVGWDDDMNSIYPMTDPWCWYINANMTGVY